ncbi:hypothetical protein PPYR_08127 [Photinus pyralis]|uniref:Regulatory protein zeste n=1 Tax=Photinus pyralis TaxID=7054 RepID=A0A5N4AIK9_PHOPY|nr:uncharacterized protein LOC116160591 [Photinus pyralis]XP_031345367.1 uncharacterized protein LOC116172307 [Photinus pyralis]KAB0797133.1 hypothetical protein PPYR_08127 [Photinus pyralis]
MEARGSPPPTKKQRTANYSTDEKNVLFSIICDYKGIIECKKTNAVTWKEKEATWEKISCKFNAQSPGGVYRNVTSLKKCYENAKKTVRKNVAHERLEYIKTGGGTPNTIVDDKNEDLILSIVNPKTVVGIHNTFDCDMVMECLPEDIAISTTMSHEALPVSNLEAPSTSASEMAPEAEEDVDWGDYKVAHLKTPVNKALQTSGNTNKKNGHPGADQWVNPFTRQT